jgi:hypothetical protein
MLRLHYAAALHLLPPCRYISCIDSGYKILLAHRRSSWSPNLYRRHHHRNASPSHHDLHNVGPLFEGLSKWCTAATTTATAAIPTTTTTTTTIYATTIPAAAAAGGEAFRRQLLLRVPQRARQKNNGQPPPEEVQAALLRSFETARQQPNDSTAVYSVEDVVLKDNEDADLEDGENADLKDGRRRRATLLAKQRREALPTMLSFLHRQMVRSRMERRHAKTKRVAHQEREDGTKTAHDVDAGPSSASNDENDDGEAAA